MAALRGITRNSSGPNQTLTIRRLRALTAVAARAASKSLRAFSRMSPLANTALPATRISAPARTISPTVSRATPPSISMRNSRPRDSRMRTSSSIFLERVWNEMLRAKSRIHGHDQNVMHDIQDFVEHVHRSRRIDHHARLASKRLNQVERAVQMNASFLMNGNPVRASFRKCGNKLIWIFNHQMAIESRSPEWFCGAKRQRAAQW